MSKFCSSCGVGNPDNAKICLRCGKPLQMGSTPPVAQSGNHYMPLQGRPPEMPGNTSADVSGKKQKSHYLLIGGMVTAVLLAVVMITHMGGGADALSKEECDVIFSSVLSETMSDITELYAEDREDKPVGKSEPEITVDGESAMVVYRLTASYNYANCEAVIQGRLTWLEGDQYSDGTWSIGSTSEVSYCWDYHDLEGTWQEKDWTQSWVQEFDEGPSTLVVEKSEAGYTFTATENWVSDYLGETVEVTTDELNQGTDGEARLIPKGYATESTFQWYNLNPEEGITDMEKN